MQDPHSGPHSGPVAPDPASPAAVPACANCRATLAGPFCSHCGQEARNLHRPFPQLVAEVAEDVFSVDTRFMRTIRPLILRPGAVTADYLGGRRAAYVPPLRSYLISALIFFGLFSIFPNRMRVEVFVGETKSATTGGSRLTFDLPGSMSIGNEWYEQAAARAKADPDRFAAAVGVNVPRVFFLFLPVFAALLELFYRREGYYVDHLVFALYYHSVAFLVASCVFLIGRTDAWSPVWIRMPLSVALVLWLIAYLPISLRRVYGGSRSKTALKLLGLVVLYWVAYAVIGIPLLLLGGLLTI